MRRLNPRSLNRRSLNPRSGISRITHWYGASPLHLLALLASFALAGYAAAQLVPSRPAGVAVWFAGAVVGHDLVLMPLYSIADRSVLAAVRHRAPNLPATSAPISSAPRAVPAAIRARVAAIITRLEPIRSAA